MVKEIEKRVEEFVREYYFLLDSEASSKSLQEFFYKDDFEIIEGDMKIESLEEYSNWYEVIKKLFSKKLHIINSIDIKKEDSFFKVEIDMDFEGLKTSGESISLKDAKIFWQIKEVNKKFKIKRYEINI